MLLDAGSAPPPVEIATLLAVIAEAPVAVSPLEPAPEVCTEPPVRMMTPPLSAWAPGLPVPLVVTATPVAATADWLPVA